MARMFDVLPLLILGSMWISVTSDSLPKCWTPRCSCCKDQVCEKDNDDYCTNGCIDGVWGHRCYNECPGNCAKCTHTSTGGLPCTSCKAGTFGWWYQCTSNCSSECASCNNRDACNECVIGRYGTNCNNKCSNGCVDGICTKTDGSCICVSGRYGARCENTCANGCQDGSCDQTYGTCSCHEGFAGVNCDQCASHTYGSYPSCFACPDKCLTCTSQFSCETCADGNYNGRSAVSGDTVSDCSLLCRTTCNSCSSYDSCNECCNGYWGQSCLYRCSNGCNEGICDKSNGRCSCELWFKGVKCDQCISGRYGENCEQACQSTNCEECGRQEGICSSCKVGYYGNSQCNSVCSSGCNNRFCDFNDGICTNGCLPNYSGDTCCVNNDNCKTCSSSDQCSDCKPGYSGDKCCVNNYRCITCSSPSACSQCISGYSGDKCCLSNNFCQECSSNTDCSKCIDGRYGTTCTDTCPENCAETSCKNDGFCYSCKSGYYGSECEFGCLQKCEECKQNGECTKCIDGYYGSSCDRCPPTCVSCSSISNCDNCYTGYYGNVCENQCSDCKEGTGCEQTGGKCDTCKDGKFLTNCNNDCDTVCAACHRDSRYKCSVCASGRYGKHSSKSYYRCNNKCSSNCLNNACNESTGYCDTCIKGYNGDFCGCPVNCQCSEAGKCYACVEKFSNTNTNCTECALNLYDVDCQTECNNNCLDNDQNTKCLGTNGTCIVGCVNGFFGNRCDLACDQNCLNGTCSMLSGICSNRCKHGFTASGAECVIAAANSDPDGGGSSGSVIGGAVGGILAIIAVVLVLLFLKRRRANNGKCSSAHTNEGRQNNSNNISDSVLGYDNTTESVNMNAADADKNINNVVQPASNTNYNKAPILPKHKAEHKRKSDKLGDLRKSVKSDFLQISAQSQDMRKSTKSVASNIDVDDVDNDVVIPLSTATEGNYGYYNLDGLKKGIPVDKLAALVSKRDTANFEQEFKEFDTGLVRPYLDSQKPQNRARNRYQHIYPYDEHRVHLQGSSTDYINASYIDGYQHPKEYIACLGPTEKATEDFVIVWMMIWEQRVEKIVMVTNLFENAAMKCEQYWPDVTTSQNYGDVTVTCHSEDEYADYTLRSFTVSKGSENRSLHHIHYTAWPDKGVPDNVTSIIEFRQRVNSIQTKLRGPVIVHCSAGIGRTGTYIALDSLTKEGQYTQSVDIYGCVKKMREQRVNMVQTYEQYHYLHSAVVHSLTFDCAAVTAEQFNKHFKKINDKTIAEKFKQIQLTVENRSEEETKAIAVNKKHKHLNHAGADIPGDYRRPKLHLNKDPGDCDYINAVFVNSFKTKNRFIVAMTPLPGTVLDFMTLLYQENCSCIVSLEAPESLNDKNVGTYYPADNQELKHDVFKVTCTKGVPSDSYVMRKLTITYNRQAESTSKTFTHFQFTKWSRRIYVPNDTATFLQLISDVEAKANATADNGPILIHCLNGASRSGLFCAVSILRQKMEIEHEVSVVNTVRYIKSRRPSAIPNKDQYAFCHQAVVAYLDTFDKDIYSNFSLKL